MWTYSYWTFLAGIIAICLLVMYRIYVKYEPRNRLQSWLAWIFLGGFVVFLLFVNELFPGSKIYYDYQYSEKITGRSMKIADVYTYESYREPLLGDGYSLYIYKFDEESAEYFRNPSESFFSDYPSDLSGNSSWTHKSWTKCPIDEADSSYQKFALNDISFYNGKTSVTKLNKVERLVGELLNEKGNYYAYRAHWFGEHVWNIAFYVISPDDGWLVVIYSDM